MGFAVRLAVAFAVLWLDAAVAQEGYFGHDHEKWHHGFYQTLERPDTKARAGILPIVVPPQGDRSMDTTR